MSAALFSTASRADRDDKHGERGRPPPALARSQGRGPRMPNQAPAQLNHSFTHSFTLNNNNLTLFGFLSYFCCLSLALFRRPLALPLSPLRGEEGRKGTTNVAITEGKAALPSPSQTDPTERETAVLASSARPSPCAKGARGERVYSQRFAEAGAKWRLEGRQGWRRQAKHRRRRERRGKKRALRLAQSAAKMARSLLGRTDEAFSSGQK